MVNANIVEVFIGIESPNEEALRETKKIQNLTDRHGSLLDKVRRIQQAGIEVWCGMIVGFDTDDASVFDLQRCFLRDARIPLAMVNILVAIPRTPLFTRLEKEGRLDNSGELADFGTINTNVIPKRISRRALCDGYLALMRELYEPEAYFGRLDSLYLHSEQPPTSAQTRYLRRHPLLWLKSWSWSMVETVYIVTQLMRGVPDATLRRDYRRRLWNVVKRGDRLHLLRVYAIKCALHFHFDRLITQMLAERAQLENETDCEHTDFMPRGFMRQDAI
jgi:hypothetical protein